MEKVTGLYGFLNLTNYRFNVLTLKPNIAKLNVQAYNADFPGDIQKSQAKFSKGRFIKLPKMNHFNNT